MNVVLYSTGCPRCNVLKAKLANKNIKYEEVNDEEYMLSIGLDEMPVLEVDGKRMSFGEANQWLNVQRGNE